ncbi:MAG: cytochrome c [Marinoscillum sp.]
MRWLAFTFLLLYLSANILAQSTATIPTDPARIANGKKLYQDECSRCHLFGEQKIGPSLASITDKRTTGWLLGFIQNSQIIIQSGNDPYALHLFKQYNHMIMPEFQHLSESERLDILAFIEDVSIMKNYSYTEDSVNYYDEDIISMAENRVAQKDAEETDYYANPSIEPIPNDLETIQVGESLFNEQCQTCHELDKRKTGPALASVTDRLPLNWLLDFINSPKEMMESGDDYANFLVTHYPLVMPDFKFLTKEDKMAILAYIRYEAGAPTHVAGANANAIIDPHQDTTSQKVAEEDRPKPSKEESTFYPVFYVVGLILMVGLVVVLIVIVWKTFTLDIKRKQDDKLE